MKKILFATTAIVAAGFTSAATAAEWETTVGGYYFIGLGLSDSDFEDGVGVLRDGEVSIDGTLTADNGVVFAAHFEIEANTSADQIDENWGAVRGSFGRIKIGGDDDAMYNYQVGTIYAPGARVGYYDQFCITNACNNGPNGGSFLAPFRGSDQIGIHYDTPNFNGFQLGFSYIPDAGTDGTPGTDGVNDNNVINFAEDNFYSIGANYQGDFGDFGFGLSGGYADSDASNGDAWNVGTNVSFGGFTVAGLYEDDPGTGEEYALGAQYATGPWTVAGGYAGSIDRQPGSESGQAAAWVTYALAPGVLMTGAIEYADNGPAENLGGLAFMTLRF